MVLKEKEYTIIFYQVKAECRMIVRARSRAEAGARAKLAFDKKKRHEWAETEVATLHRILEYDE